MDYIDVRATEVSTHTSTAYIILSPPLPTPPSWRPLQNLHIDLLQTLPLGLVHKQPHKSSTNEYTARKHPTKSVPNAGGHFVGEEPDQEVEDPVCSCGGAHTSGFPLRREYLRTDYPDEGTPGCSEADYGHAGEDDHGYTGGVCANQARLGDAVVAEDGVELGFMLVCCCSYTCM